MIKRESLKFFWITIICLSSFQNIDPCYGREIILITFEDYHDHDQAKGVQEIMVKIYDIPFSFIRTQFRSKENKLGKQGDSLLHLHINEQRKIEIIEVNENFLEKTIPLFLKKKEMRDV